METRRKQEERARRLRPAHGRAERIRRTILRGGHKSQRRAKAASFSDVRGTVAQAPEQQPGKSRLQISFADTGFPFVVELEEREAGIGSDGLCTEQPQTIDADGVR